MSDIRVKCHPQLGILVCTDGHVMVPATKGHPAHWTLGSDNSHGYLHVQIAGKNYKIHRLVAQTFIGQIPQGYEVDHINRNPSDNRMENLRIVTHSENQRNTPKHDRVEAQGRTHFYEDEKQYNREYYTENKTKIIERQSRHYTENRDKISEKHARSYQSKRKTHRIVHFSDGSKHWIPNEEALELLKIPRSQRVFKG